jgi:hypothetical protein
LLELSGKVGLRVCRHDEDEEGTKTITTTRGNKEREREIVANCEEGKDR